MTLFRSGKSDRSKVQVVQSVQALILRQSQGRLSVLARGAGDEGGGLNDWNALNDLNAWQPVATLWKARSRL